jgi:hypothetical protein
MFRAGYCARRSAADWLALGLAMLGTLSACGGRVAPGDPAVSQESPNGSGAMPGQAGTVSAQVRLPAGVNVTTVSYSVSGPPGLHRSWTQDFPSSQLIAFLISDLPPASDYMLDVSMIGEVGSMTCTATGSFAVLAGLQTNVVLDARCA